VSFRHAVAVLKHDAPINPANAATDKPLRVVNSTVRHLAPPVVADADDTALLQQVIDYYHQTLQHSPEALAYLQSRGLNHPELIEHFKLGFANRTLGLRLPAMTRKAGAEVRTRLQHLGLLRESGHEHFNGSLVIPVIGISGLVHEIYGRKITPNLRPGTPQHLYLPGPHGGVFNEAGLIGQAEIILCEALIDALTFWCAGVRNVTSAFGVEGFTEELLQALITHGVQRVLIAYDNDAAGNAAAEKLSRKLMSHGIDAYRCQFPSGMDANAFALSMPSASEALGMVIRQAEWLGNGVAPARVLSAPMVTIRETDDLSLVAASLAVDALDESVAKESMAIVEKEINALEKKPDALPAYRVPPSVPVLAVEIDQKELRLTLGDREYTVRGIEKNLSYEQLKVWLRARRGN
ncbi:MAG: toprim domain-containing protein, partial [Methylococcales bacterium]